MTEIPLIAVHDFTSRVLISVSVGETLLWLLGEFVN